MNTRDTGFDLELSRRLLAAAGFAGSAVVAATLAPPAWRAPPGRDAIDNRAFVDAGKLTMPVLAVGGEKSLAGTMAVVMRAVAIDVQEQVIPNSGTACSAHRRHTRLPR